ncbi:MAG TPA: ferritin-like domain-containing protein [Chitinophagaceae bacterium]|nr:ferritin-like domain-containing protein [Chitinophagaceae bacterium]
MREITFLIYLRIGIIPAGFNMTLSHKKLIDLLQRAYSAEKAASFAYQGHAGSVKDKDQKTAIRQIELDEWNHRREVMTIMKKYGIPASGYYEIRFHIIGKVISGSCYVIGWFMPFYFAGRLESGNVCEYFRMMHYFHELGIREHDHILYEMGMKEKEHELYFLEKIKDSRLLPFFEKIFSWGGRKSFNDVDLEKKYSVEASSAYCKNE